MDAKVFIFEGGPVMLGISDADEAAASYEQYHVEPSGQEFAGPGQLGEVNGRHMKTFGIVQTSAHRLKHRTFTPIRRRQIYYHLPTT